jgi:hypothetical protein
MVTPFFLIALDSVVSGGRAVRPVYRSRNADRQDGRRHADLGRHAMQASAGCDDRRLTST